tara:strand:- start:5159 stop:6553 length:1395 start_codon:yes stop_codon:yes gene_type:complete
MRSVDNLIEYLGRGSTDLAPVSEFRFDAVNSSDFINKVSSTETSVNFDQWLSLLISNADYMNIKYLFSYVLNEKSNEMVCQFYFKLVSDIDRIFTHTQRLIDTFDEVEVISFLNHVCISGSDHESRGVVIDTLEKAQDVKSKIDRLIYYAAVSNLHLVVNKLNDIRQRGFGFYIQDEESSRTQLIQHLKSSTMKKELIFGIMISGQYSSMDKAFELLDSFDYHPQVVSSFLDLHGKNLDIEQSKTLAENMIKRNKAIFLDTLLKGIPEHIQCDIDFLGHILYCWKENSNNYFKAFLYSIQPKRKHAGDLSHFIKVSKAAPCEGDEEIREYLGYIINSECNENYYFKIRLFIDLRVSFENQCISILNAEIDENFSGSDYEKSSRALNFINHELYDKLPQMRIQAIESVREQYSGKITEAGWEWARLEPMFQVAQIPAKAFDIWMLKLMHNQVYDSETKPSMSAII